MVADRTFPLLPSLAAATCNTPSKVCAPGACTMTPDLLIVGGSMMAATRGKCSPIAAAIASLAEVSVENRAVAGAPLADGFAGQYRAGARWVVADSGLSDIFEAQATGLQVPVGHVLSAHAQYSGVMAELARTAIGNGAKLLIVIAYFAALDSSALPVD